jgi:Uma2 family endonuclease
VSIAAQSSQVPFAPQIPLAGEKYQLDDVSWEDYVAISDSLPETAAIHATYDGQHLEIMGISQEHERYGMLIASLVTTLCMETGIDYICGGSLTLRGKLINRGLEPDKCFWMANYPPIIGIRRWEPKSHPPPDLAIEIDITSGSLPREPIYAKLGVPELWRFDGRILTALRLNDDEEYEPTAMSHSFPFLEVSQLVPFVKLTFTQSDSAINRKFIHWVKQQNFPQS